MRRLGGISRSKWQGQERRGSGEAAPGGGSQEQSNGKPKSSNGVATTNGKAATNSVCGPSEVDELAGIDVPEDLCAIQSYIRWERNGKQNYRQRSSWTPQGDWPLRHSLSVPGCLLQAHVLYLGARPSSRLQRV